MRSNNNIIAQLSNEKIATNDNIVNDVDEVIKLINKGNVLIKFYSLGCGHCSSMMPEWNKLINMQSPTHPPHTIISIESSFLGEPKIAALISRLKINVSGFPTIVFVTSNKAINYNGPRTAHDMNNFITTHTSKVKHSGGSKKYVGKRHNTRRRHNRRNRRNKTKRGGCGCGI